VRGARIAVSAGVQAAAVGVDAEAKAHVGAVVLDDQRLGLLLVDLELRGRRLAEPLDVNRRPRVGRVGHGANHVMFVFRSYAEIKAEMSRSPPSDGLQPPLAARSQVPAHAMDVQRG